MVLALWSHREEDVSAAQVEIFGVAEQWGPARLLQVTLKQTMVPNLKCNLLLRCHMPWPPVAVREQCRGQALQCQLSFQRLRGTALCLHPALSL